MTEQTRSPMIIPAMRYRDPKAAMAFLEAAFGFRRGFVVEDPEGGVDHAQLHLGGQCIMLGSMRADAALPMFKSPEQLGGVSHCLYVATDEVEALFEQAKGAGAEVLIALRDTEYGSREFSVLDTEGHVWSFGSYFPEA